MPEDEYGKKPSPITLNSWITQYGWIERADALDGEVSIALDNEIINRRAQMFKEHADIGAELLNKGRAYLKSNAFEDSADAIRAIDLGVNIQRISVGQEQAWMKISKMTDSQVQKEFERLTGKIGNGVEIEIEGAVEEDSNESSLQEAKENTTDAPDL